jgi:large subunit ribosomal protein L21e
MPFKAYHGKTGRVYNVTQHALGVIVNKRVRGEVLPKRINVRVEHVKPSRCREEFLARIKSNDEKRRQATAEGKRIILKRKPEQPLPARVIVNPPEPVFLAPIPYEFVA